MRTAPRSWSPVMILALAVLAQTASLPAEEGPGPVPSFRCPANPPSSEYRIDAKIAFAAGSAEIDGREPITLINNAPRALTVLALQWNPGPSPTLDLSAA